jgi:Amt family ammonium transporter
MLRKRLGHGKEQMHPHNLPMTLTGAALLWFGWFGFNAGSALGAGALAASTFLTTNTATAASALTWMILEWWYRGKPSALGAATGAVAGLVAITPASGFVGPISSIWIGMGAGGLCYLAVMLKPLFGYDDALDAVGVHGVGGMWGALATGLFASKAVNSAGADGLFFGNPAQLGIQAMAVLVTIVFVFVGTLIILAIVGAITGLRVSEEDEQTGLDLSQHDEKAYSQG